MKSLKKGIHITQITQTIQPRSLTKLSKEGKNLNISKSENESNVKLLLALCGSLNELYEKLSKLSYVMEEKIKEHNLSQGEKQ